MFGVRLVTFSLALKVYFSVKLAIANPIGGEVVGGTANIIEDGAKLTIT